MKNNYYQRIHEKIEQMIEEGLEDVGTPFESLLFSSYVNKELTRDELCMKLYVEAQLEVGEEMIEEELEDVCV